MVTIDSIALTCQMNITNLHSSSIQHHFHRTSTSHPGAPLPVQTMQLRHRAVATWRQALTWPWPQSFPLSLLNERCETNLNTQQVSNKKKNQWELWNYLWNILNTNYLSVFRGFSERVSCFPELTGWVFASPNFPMIPRGIVFAAEKVGRNLPTSHFPFPDRTPPNQPTAWWLHWNQDLCPYWLLHGIDDFFKIKDIWKGPPWK